MVSVDVKPHVSFRDLFREGGIFLFQIRPVVYFAQSISQYAQTVGEELRVAHVVLFFFFSSAPVQPVQLDRSHHREN